MLEEVKLEGRVYVNQSSLLCDWTIFAFFELLNDYRWHSQLRCLHETQLIFNDAPTTLN